MIIQGVYINNIYYGDYRNLTPIQDILVKLALISFILGFFTFIFAFELIIRRSKFILSIIQLLFIVLILILPFELIYNFIYHIILVYGIINSIILLFYITNLSQYEFKAIPSFLLLGGSLMTIAFYLCSPIVKVSFNIPLFFPPIIFILGCSIALFPLLVNPKKIENALKIWKIMGFLTILDQILIIIFHILSKLYLFILVSLIDLIVYIILYQYTIKNIEKEHIKHYAIKGKEPISNVLKAFIKKSIEEIYRLIIENANDLIMIFNAKFEIELINEKSCQKLLGYSKSDLIVENIRHFIHTEDIEKIEQFQKNILLNGEDSAEVRIRKKDNSYLWFEIKGVLFKDFNQNAKLLTISRDITDHKIAQKIVEKENIRLNKLDELRKEFIARASHDINNPLGSLVLTLNMLKYKYHTQEFENLEENIDDILIQAQRVQNLAVNLLDYAMIEMHRFQIKREKINVSKVILSCVNNEKPRGKERGIDISYNLPEELVLYGDELVITRIFQNLISNAINYTQKFKKGKIAINAEKSENVTRISIKDNGIGLTKEDINKLFDWECKIQKDQDDIIEGSGIGLYITKQIVESHGGKIFVESNGLNRGSTFNVEFPIN